MNAWGIRGENMLLSLGIYNWCKHTFLLFDYLETQYHIVLQRMAFIPKKGIRPKIQSMPVSASQRGILPSCFVYVSIYK